MRMMSRPHHAAMWAIAAFAVTAATVGGGGPAHAVDQGPVPPSLRALSDAAAATGRGSGTVTVELIPATVLGRRPPSVRGTGAFDFARNRGTVELSGAAGSEKVVFLPQAMFIRQPRPASGASPLPAGRSWVSAGLNETPGPGSGLPLFVDQIEVVNVALILDEIRWGATDARPLGNKPVGGTSATGYAVTVNLRRAQSAARGLDGPALARVLGYQVAALAPKNSTSATVRVGVWVGQAGRVVQVEWSPPGGGVGTTSITVSALHGGVRADAPPPSQTVDVATLTPAGEKEGGLGDVA
jgi:hypothetical protein